MTDPLPRNPMNESNIRQMAERGLSLAMRRAYAQAKAAGTLERTSSGWEVFQMDVPVEGMPPWTCARMPDGQFRINLNHLHQGLAPQVPWEHFEHQAHVIAQRIETERRGSGRGFGHG